MEDLFILRIGMAEGSCGDKAEISTLDLKKILHELMRGKAAEKGKWSLLFNSLSSALSQAKTILFTCKRDAGMYLFM